MKKTLLVGAGGHARAVIDFLKDSPEIEVVGLVEKDGFLPGQTVAGFPVIGTDSMLADLFRQGIGHALITVGGTGDNSLREALYRKTREIGFAFINALHPSAIISSTVEMGDGNTFMAGTIIGPGTTIGNNVLVNTGAIIEHDCRLEDHIHIGPGARIAGGVEIKNGSHIGIGAVVIQNRKIGRDALVAAGAVVIDDVPDRAVVAGVPARIIKYR